MFYKLLNSYVQKYSLPKRGLKYFLKAMRFLGIADKEYLKKLPGNILMKLKPEEHIQQQLFWYGHYEKSIGIVLKKLLQPDSVFLDIGANIGYFALLAAQAVPQGKVIAFEPVSYLYESLQGNVILNKFANIELIKSAAGDKEEERLIYLSAENNTGMSSLQQPPNYSGNTEMVKVISIDNWFTYSRLLKIDTVKIDVEGNELAVLKGMKEVIKLFQPSIVLELSPQTFSYFNTTTSELLNYMDDLSYNAFAITKSGKPISIDNTIVKETIDLLLIHSTKTSTVLNHLK